MSKKRKIVYMILIFIGCFFISLTKYIRNNFSDEYFEQIIFSLYSGKGTSTTVLLNGLLNTLPRFFILCILFFGIYLLYKYEKKYFKYSLGDRLEKIIPIIIFIICCLISLNNIGIINYFSYQFKTSKLIEEEYVNPNDVDVTFTNEKNNLIYIYVESFENSALSISHGGYEKVSVIPNMEKLALTNTNFSNTKKLGGAHLNQGNSWTAASLIGQTSGIPLKVSLTNNLYEDGRYLNGVKTLGEILEENGYKNYFMLGSLGEFGNRSDYFEEHGNYEVYDYLWARDEGLINEDYYEWWGYEDSKLYSFAKDKLLEISKNNEPFNFTMLTADTHFPDGYIDNSCKDYGKSHYRNSYSCTDYMLSNFIKWIEEQDFYDNTTIIITGDHLTMQKSAFNVSDTKKRTIYNTIINSRVDSINTTNRTFTVMDMYPTTIASIGGNIPGERLGLGTNLYSGTKTLAEEYGIKKFDRELKKKSEFYNKNILKKTW